MQEIYRTKLADAGRIVIPAELRRELDLNEGQEIVFVRGQGSIELLTPAQVLARVQATVRQYIPDEELDLTQEILDARKTDGSFA